MRQNKTSRVWVVLIGLCQMLKERQDAGGQQSTRFPWFERLAGQVKEYGYGSRDDPIQRRRTHVVNGRWLARLDTSPGQLKPTTLSAVRHLKSIAESGRGYDRVGCLAIVSTTGVPTAHCIALILERRSIGFVLRVYDPNGSTASTNPFWSTPSRVSDTGDLEAFLSRELGPLLIQMATPDSVGIQARMPIMFGLCTVFAAFGLAKLLGTEGWSDHIRDVRELQRWCLMFADGIGLPFERAEEDGKKKLESAATKSYQTTIVHVREGRQITRVRRSFKTRQGKNAWIDTTLESIQCRIFRDFEQGRRYQAQRIEIQTV